MKQYMFQEKYTAFYWEINIKFHSTKVAMACYYVFLLKNFYKEEFQPCNNVCYI